ncbi:hypothetical protein [Lacipirellula limnantheis]|uniref:Uncharacterized protein n=1 Tax=Lacipirellula limnantheis TaxID=2528024 RepID=A0A517TVR9_9BACT|nr:hypothetical protein [Lacipirellula limnantheis]QDT72466.1 hypothetical protein I41_16440 [Lacipirellula limnantheis]
MELNSRNVALKYGAFSGVYFALLIWRRVSRHAPLEPRYLGFAAIILVVSAVLAWRYEVRKGTGLDWFTSFLVSMVSVMATSAAAFAVGYCVLLAAKKLS